MQLIADFPEDTLGGQRPDGWVRLELADSDVRQHLDELRHADNLQLQVLVGERRYRSDRPQACPGLFGEPMGLNWRVRLSSLGRFTMEDRRNRQPGQVHFQLLSVTPAEPAQAEVIAETRMTWMPGWNRFMAVITTFAALPLTLATFLFAPGVLNDFGDERIISTLVAAAALLGVSTAGARAWLKHHLHRLDVASAVLTLTTITTAYLWSLLVVVYNLTPIPTPMTDGNPPLAPGEARLTIGAQDTLIGRTHRPAVEPGPRQQLREPPVEELSAVAPPSLAKDQAAIPMRHAQQGLSVSVFRRIAQVLGLKHVVLQVVCARPVPTLFQSAWRESESCDVRQPLHRTHVEVPTDKGGHYVASLAYRNDVDPDDSDHWPRMQDRDISHAAPTLDTYLKKHFVQLDPGELSRYGFRVEMQGSDLLTAIEAPAFQWPIPTPTRANSETNARVGMRFLVGDAELGSLELWGRLGKRIKCTPLRTTGGHIEQLAARALLAKPGAGATGDAPIAYAALFRAKNPTLTHVIPICLPDDGEATLDVLEIKLARGFVPDTSWRLTLPDTWNSASRIVLYTHNDTRIGTLRSGSPAPGRTLGPLREQRFALPERARVCLHSPCRLDGQAWEGNPALPWSSEWFWLRWTDNPPAVLHIEQDTERGLTQVATRPRSDAATTRTRPPQGHGGEYLLHGACGPCYVSMTGHTYPPGACAPEGRRQGSAITRAMRENVERLIPCCGGAVQEVCDRTPPSHAP